MIPVLIVSVCIVLLAVGLMAIRILLVKNGQFRGTCAGNSPFLKKDGVVCGVCGSRPGEACGSDENKTFTSKSQV